MIPAEQITPPRWSALRWLIVVALIASVQGALILRFSQWPTLPNPSISSGTTIDLESGLIGTSANRRKAPSWTGDPRLFALPDQVAFSGLAAQALPPPEYQLARWALVPRWLPGAADGSHLGSIPIPEAVAAAPRRLPVPRMPPDSPTPLVLSSGTRASLGGDLTSRAFEESHALPALTGADVLPPTVLELTVSAGGAVLFTRLISSCGQRDVDALAVDWARTLRFEPTDYESSPAVSDPTRWTIGQISVHWRVQPTVR